MPTVAEELALAVQKALDGSGKLYDVANGPDTDVVQTDSGPVPTVSKWFKDKNESVEIYLDGKINEVIGPVQGHADSAAASAASATTSAQAASNSASLAQDEANIAVANAAQAALDRTATGQDAASALASKNAAATSASEASTDRATIEVAIASTFGAAVPVGTIVAFQSRAHLTANEGYMPLDGQVVNRSALPASFVSLLTAGTLPVESEATWNSNISARGKYTLGDGSTTVRFPDLNGKSAGSLKASFLRGDGAGTLGAGVITPDAFQGHSFQLETGSTAGGSLAGVSASSRTTNSGGVLNGMSATLASDGTNGTPRTASETRPVNTAVVWAVRVFGLAQTPVDLEAEQARDEAAASAVLAGQHRAAAEAAQAAAEQAAADAGGGSANVKHYGSIADGTSHPLSELFATLAEAQVVYPHAVALTDEIDWAAFQAALNAGTARVHLPDGHYILNRGNTRTTDIVLTGDGYATHLDYSTSTGGLLISGTLTQIGDLSSDVTKGARALTFGAAPAVTAGKVLCVFNPTDGSWLSDRAPYRDGEFFRVHSVSGNTVSVYGNSTSGYTAASMDVYRLDGVRAVIDNLRASPSATFSVAPVKVLFGDGVRVKNYWGSNVNLYTGLEVERCFDVDFQAATSLNNSPAVGDEYGLTVSNCQNVTISGGATCSTRHAIALGGMYDVCCVPNRNVLVYGMTIENVDIASDIGAADMHGNCDGVTYDNCIMRNGANMQGRNVTFRNCTIYGVSSTSGEAIYGSEIYGGTYTVENCRLVTFGNGASFGVVHITPGLSQREPLHLIVRNLTVEAPNATASTKVVFLRSRSAPLAANALLDSIHLIAPATCMAFLFADDSIESTMISDYLIVDNVFGPAGTSLIYPVADIAAVPTRQMEQTGYADITTSAAQINAAAGNISFRYPYSKIPTASAGISSQSGAVQGLIGTVAPIPVVYALAATSIRPAIVSHSGSFAAGTAARLHWRAGIKDI